jgi:hypothetical protein
VLLLTVAIAACGPPREPISPPPGVATKPSPRPVLALPGACVDPAVDAVARLGPDADAAGLRTEANVDLDGDGTLDPLITHGNFCGTGGCNWQLYVARGACGHFVGELFGVLPMVRDSVSRGLVDLEIGARDGCGGMARTETRVRFDGRAYVAAELRKCRCPEPTEGTTDDADPEKWCDPWRKADAAP